MLDKIKTDNDYSGWGVLAYIFLEINKISIISRKELINLFRFD